jgi:hypothetical protein
MATLFLCGCSQKDGNGREVTELELRAVDTCNRFLSSELRGTIGTIKVSEAFFDRSNPDRIDIAWDAQTEAGNGIVSCVTDLMALKVVGLTIDGIEVNVAP